MLEYTRKEWDEQRAFPRNEWKWVVSKYDDTPNKIVLFEHLQGHHGAILKVSSDIIFACDDFKEAQSLFALL